MSWRLEGHYVENCSCTAICPCTWSGLALPATRDRCRAIMSWHIKEGEIEGVDVRGLSIGMVIDTPPLMAQGNWKAGLLIDDRASTEQAAKLESVFWGELGGPPTWSVPFIGEKAGALRVPVTYHVEGREHRVRFGDLVDIVTRNEGGRGIFPDGPDGPTLTFPRAHPPSASPRVTIAPAVRSQIAAFGIDYGGAGTSGFTTPFKWKV